VDEVVVCGRRFSGEVLERLRGTIEEHPQWSRSRIAREVCEWLDWKGANGRRQEVSCRVALLRLERRGLVELPEPRRRIARAAASRAPLTAGAAVRGSVEELAELELVAVRGRTPALSRLWNELMDNYHYLGAGPLVGAQQRYLIRSAGQWLGALAFSASAWHSAARDRWIGWSCRAREANLARVVCNSRFLILPWVEVRNLASKILALCVQRLPEDWEQVYGYRPVLLETYVEQGRFRATCYRAANWQWVGSTRGRGRQDRRCRRAVPVKDIYVYPLGTTWQSVLCAPPARAPVPAHRREPRDWAEEEFGAAGVGDERLRKRLLVLARDFYARPQASVPQACGSDRARTKAAYRWLGHRDVSMEKVLAPHYEATARRCTGAAVVLAVQDTTSFNYSTHPALAGAGSIGPGTRGGPRGILMHDTMAYSAGGLPLGLVDVQVWVRDPQQAGKKHQRHALPIEAKESYKWLRSFQAAAALQAHCADSIVVSVGDREADVYELFVLALSRADHPKLLVRADGERLVADGQEDLRAFLRRQPVCATQEVRVPRRGQRAARTARCVVRFASVQLRPPQGKKKRAAVTLWGVLLHEETAPEGVEPLQWLLLTTLEVATTEQALEKIQWYLRRWGIEVYHRTVKSGCRIEERQLATVPRIQNCLAIDLVVAWRIVHLTMLGRDTPDLPCTVFFEDQEWKALYAFVHRSPTAVPAHPPTLREVLRTVASLGGFLGRKGDGEPGTKSLWLGLQRLDDIAGCWLAFGPESPLRLDTTPVSRNPRYG
jgi:hypothetical protein